MDVKSVDAGLLQSRYRLTKQRAAILRALGDGGHLSAETIQLFSFGGSAARYEAALDKHHHLLCTHCGELTNVYADGIAQIAQQIAEREGYTEFDHALTIVGRCDGCTKT